MTTPSSGPPPGPVWGSEARTAASLLLFAHLFAAAVAVTTYTRPSLLQQQLHELFAPYLRTLHLTAYPVSYPFARYHLTHALPSDADFACTVAFQGADGTEQTATIPPSGLQPPIRYRRYQALANAMGALADSEANEETSGILPRAVAGSILRSHDATQGVIRLRAHDPAPIEEMDNVASGRRDPLQIYRNVYEAQVLVSPGGVDLLRKSETLEAAPVDRASREGASRDRAAPRRTNDPKRPGTREK